MEKRPAPHVVRLSLSVLRGGRRGVDSVDSGLRSVEWLSAVLPLSLDPNRDPLLCGEGDLSSLQQGLAAIIVCQRGHGVPGNGRIYEDGTTPRDISTPGRLTSVHALRTRCLLAISTA